jgi:hypothetical protein
MLHGPSDESARRRLDQVSNAPERAKPEVAIVVGFMAMTHK